MAIKIKLGSRELDQPPSSSPILFVKNLLLPNMGVGKLEEKPPLFPVGRKILYFRNKGCNICGKIDMDLMRFCKLHGVEIVIIDRWPAHGPPATPLPYKDEAGCLIDSDGSVNRAYSVAVYPTMVYIDSQGLIRNRKVGISDGEAANVEGMLSDFIGK